MLLDEIVSFCDGQYKSYGNKCGHETCNHEGMCSGSCKKCLNEIHFNSGNRDYDCQKMMYFYVCQFSYSYASQILYAFNRYKDTIMSMNKIKLMSLGCGGCPDLMAIEKFCNDNKLCKSIAYMGYDINYLWRPIHSKVKKYCDDNKIQRSLIEKDVISYFQRCSVPNINIIVISYLISSLYNTGQISKIDTLFTEIRDQVVKRKKAGEKLLIIINDINHNLRARNYFIKLYKLLNKEKSLTVSYEYVYFDVGWLNNFQKQGKAYNSRDFLFNINPTIKNEYCTGERIETKSIQLIMEVE